MRLAPRASTLVAASTFVAALVPFSLVYADAARACGGMFCSQSSPTPIDQNAEKILFEVNEDGSVTATVEIKYNGDPQDFAWIVPVSGTPDFVEVAEKDELLLLDQATQVTITPPTQQCSNPPANFSFCPGCDCADAVAFEPEEGAAGSVGGVDFTRYPSAGPFDDIVVVDGDNPDTLVTFLNDNGYRVTDAMRPFIEQYTLEGYSFLATRLRADAEVKDMVPIRFHCPQPNPEIPLRLTAIAAEPDMGFLVFVAGPSRYELAPGYENVALDVDDLQVSISGDTNYFALVSREVDEAGGRGFVVERAASAESVAALVGATVLGTDTEEAAREQLRARLGDQRFVTRLYTRMSAEEMTIDPVFVPAADDTEVAGFDLSSRIYEACPASGLPEQPPAEPPCGSLYCGEGDACAQTAAGDEGCVCRGDHVARRTLDPTGRPQVVCTSRDIDLHSGDGNPCAGETCGNAGTCIPVNDRPTCQCDEGTVAIRESQTIFCRAISGPVFEPDQISWPQPEIESTGCTSSSRTEAGSALSIAMLFASAAMMRRVLRRRS